MESLENTRSKSKQNSNTNSDVDQRDEIIHMESTAIPPIKDLEIDNTLQHDINQQTTSCAPNSVTQKQQSHTNTMDDIDSSIHAHVTKQNLTPICKAYINATLLKGNNKDEIVQFTKSLLIESDGVLNVYWNFYHHNAAVFLDFESEDKFQNTKSRLSKLDQRIDIHKAINTKITKLSPKNNNLTFPSLQRNKTEKQKQHQYKLIDVPTHAKTQLKTSETC